MRFACVQRIFDDGECTAFVIPVLFKFDVRRFHPCRLYDQYTDVFETEKEALEFKAEVISESNGEKLNPPRQTRVPWFERKKVIF